jgi:uncharacterized damage-inducible protein DinB
MTGDDLRSLYAYNRWADERVIAAVGGLSAEDYAREPAPGWSSVRATLIHVADAMGVWSRRLDGETPALRRTEADVPTFDEAVALLRAHHDAFDRHVASLTPERLASVWSYRNIQGVGYRVPLWAVFRHVANHATYHRGQVASKLKLLGATPPSTDLVVWAFEQVPQDG